jgi:sugar phosphate isomerase/epimerase
MNLNRWCKLAILTDEVSQELSDVIRFAKELDLDGIEVRSLFGRAFKDLTGEDLRSIATATREAGVAVSGCATPVFKCNLDSPTEIAEHVELFKRSVEAAQLLGTNMLRVFTFLRQETPSTSDQLKRAADQMPKLLEAVQGTEMIIGIENEYSTIVGFGSEVREFWGYLPPSPHWTLVWDPCNVLYLPGPSDPVRDDFPQCAGFVGHVHIKDGKRNGLEAARVCIEVGTGDVDYPEQFRLLKAQGYNGWITLETHWRQVALSAESAHLPAGYGFSHGAEPASRICVEHVKRFVEGVG